MRHIEEILKEIGSLVITMITEYFMIFFIPGYLIKNFRIKINIKMLNKQQRIFHIKLCSLSTRTVKTSKLRIKNDSVFNV